MGFAEKSKAGYVIKLGISHKKAVNMKLSRGDFFLQLACLYFEIEKRRNDHLSSCRGIAPGFPVPGGLAGLWHRKNQENQCNHVRRWSIMMLDPKKRQDFC